MLCEYGCGQEAIYTCKNGKNICNKVVSKCPAISKKSALKNKGKTHSKEVKCKLSKLMKNKWKDKNSKFHSEEYKETRRINSTIRKHSEETKEKIRQSKIGNKNPMFGKKLSESHRRKIGESCKVALKGRKQSEETKRKIGESKRGTKWSDESKDKLKKTMTEKNPFKGKSHSNETKIKIRLSQPHLMTISKINKRYPLFSKIEEMRYNPDKPGEKEIQVHCKNHKCKNSKENNGWFTPTRSQIFERIRHIENSNGSGGSYFYCCNECKNECPIYNKKVIQLIREDQIRAGIIKEEYHTNKEYNVYREEVLKRSKYKCEYCGEKAEHVHHSRPQKLEPFFSLDPDYGIACCKTCHYEKGHVGECSTGQLAYTICI